MHAVVALLALVVQARCERAVRVTYLTLLFPDCLVA
jgi:hypothetical protein